MYGTFVTRLDIRVLLSQVCVGGDPGSYAVPERTGRTVLGNSQRPQVSSGFKNPGGSFISSFSRTVLKLFFTKSDTQPSINFPFYHQI